MDFFRDFVMGFCDVANANISRDERLSVGCLLVEYLIPLMEDPYYMEIQIIRFLSELVGLQRSDLADVTFTVFDISFSDEYLNKWIT